MAELEAQGLAPLEVVAFEPSTGVGDVIMGMALDAAEDTQGAEEDELADEESDDEVTVQRYVLKVANVSDRRITAFRGTLTFEDEQGQVVTSEKASPDARYAPDMGEGIDPGATEELELQLLIPQGTKAKIAWAEVLYEDEGLGGIWMPSAVE
jgi:hypothetical protein